MERYDEKQFDPPAPIVMVKVSNPYAKVSKKSKGKIDTGAFKTAIPEGWVEELGLIQAGETDVSGYDGKIDRKWTYYANISFKECNFYTEVIPANRKNVLIGRDVLNQLKVLLDGKNLNLEITDPK